jgi:hypothetical protein
MYNILQVLGHKSRELVNKAPRRIFATMYEEANGG